MTRLRPSSSRGVRWFITSAGVFYGVFLSLIIVATIVIANVDESHEFGDEDLSLGYLTQALAAFIVLCLPLLSAHLGFLRLSRDVGSPHWRIFALTTAWVPALPVLFGSENGVQAVAGLGASLLYGLLVPPLRGPATEAA